jgi:PAS domain S-box-containing protein
MTDQTSIERTKKARTIIDKAYDAFIEIDINSIIVDWNAQAEIIFGWSHQEVVGQRLSEIIIPPQYREAHLRGLEHLKNTGEGPVLNKKIEITALHRTGREFPIELAIFPVSLEGTTSYCAFIRDISDRKKVELTLRETEESFRLLVSGVKDYAIFMLSPEGNIITWNEGAERIIGYEASEVIGKHFSCFYGQEDRDNNKPKHELEIAVLNGSYEETGLRLRKDGSPFWANVVITSLFNESAQLKGFTKITRDISEQKKTTDELQIQADMLNSTFDAIIVRDLDGTIRYWNAGAERMYGFTGQEAIGKISHHLLNTKFPQPLTEIEKEILEQQHWDGEVLHYARNGERMIVYSRQSLKTHTKGNPTAILEINSDITANKQAEQRRLALNEMKRANVELEQFAYVASHDLQEPLRAVAGGLQILAKKYKGKLDTEADELINMAVDGANRMRTLIADLLSLSHVSTAKETFELTNLLEVFDQAVSNLALIIKETSATITHDPLPTLVVEKTRFVQLFQNLISNAIKFRSDEPCKIHFSVTNKPGLWQFSVSDNGIGFEQKFADRIFEPFKRLHGRDKYPGNGIGLTICKRIIERHGGNIWVESEPDKGTTFYFTIPDIGNTP